jgi:hypothetical protein
VTTNPEPQNRQLRAGQSSMAATNIRDPGGAIWSSGWV